MAMLFVKDLLFDETRVQKPEIYDLDINKLIVCLLSYFDCKVLKI